MSGCCAAAAASTDAVTTSTESAASAAVSGDADAVSAAGRTTSAHRLRHCCAASRAIGNGTRPIAVVWAARSA